MTKLALRAGDKTKLLCNNTENVCKLDIVVEQRSTMVTYEIKNSLLFCISSLLITIYYLVVELYINPLFLNYLFGSTSTAIHNNLACPIRI